MGTEVGLGVVLAEAVVVGEAMVVGVVIAVAVRHGRHSGWSRRSATVGVGVARQ